ncbi:ABC transporter permease subunit [Mangrovicoccus ximenensis]
MIGVALGLGLGLIAGYNIGGWADRIASVVAISGVSVPHYWLGIVLVVIFSANLNWLPAMGASRSGAPLDQLRHMILPALTLAAMPAGIITRSVRALVAEARARDFVPALIARGLSGTEVFLHVLKNIAPTALAVIGVQIGYLMAGSILVETVFAWPGTGTLLSQAILQRDLPLLQGTILVLALDLRGVEPGRGPCPAALRPEDQPQMTAMTATAAAAAVAAAQSPGYWARVWSRLRRDPVALICIAVLSVLFLACALRAAADPARSLSRSYPGAGSASCGSGPFLF